MKCILTAMGKNGIMEIEGSSMLHNQMTKEGF